MGRFCVPLPLAQEECAALQFCRASALDSAFCSRGTLLPVVRGPLGSCSGALGDPRVLQGSFAALLNVPRDQVIGGAM